MIQYWTIDQDGMMVIGMMQCKLVSQALFHSHGDERLWFAEEYIALFDGVWDSRHGRDSRPGISHSASFSALGIAIVQPFLDLSFFHTFPVIPELFFIAPDSRFSTKGLCCISSCPCVQMTSTIGPCLFFTHIRISLHHLFLNTLVHIHVLSSIVWMFQARENMFIYKMDVF